eukprot:scaffold6618_cov139-Isochrysis_galbana.AAC.1
MSQVFTRRSTARGWHNTAPALCQHAPCVRARRGRVWRQSLLCARRTGRGEGLSLVGPVVVAPLPLRHRAAARAAVCQSTLSSLSSLVHMPMRRT